MDLRILRVLLAIALAGCSPTLREGEYVFTREELSDGCDSGYYRNDFDPGTPHVVEASETSILIWLFYGDHYYTEIDCELDGSHLICTNTDGHTFEHGLYLGTIYNTKRFSLIRSSSGFQSSGAECSTLWATELLWTDWLSENVVDQYNKEHGDL